MSGPDTAALRDLAERIRRSYHNERAEKLRNTSGHPLNSDPTRVDGWLAPVSYREALALLDECDRLRAERDAAQEGWDTFAARMHGAEEWARAMEHERDFEQQVVSENYRFRAEAAEALAARYEQALREIAREYERWDDADREHPWDDVRAAWNAITTAKAALAAGSGEERDE